MRKVKKFKTSEGKVVNYLPPKDSNAGKVRQELQRGTGVQKSKKLYTRKIKHKKATEDW